jgi:hypothetical protein
MLSNTLMYSSGLHRGCCLAMIVRLPRGVDAFTERCHFSSGFTVGASISAKSSFPWHFSVMEKLQRG